MALCEAQWAAAENAGKALPPLLPSERGSRRAWLEGWVMQLHGGARSGDGGADVIEPYHVHDPYYHRRSSLVPEPPPPPPPAAAPAALEETLRRLEAPVEVRCNGTCNGAVTSRRLEAPVEVRCNGTCNGAVTSRRLEAPVDVRDSCGEATLLRCCLLWAHARASRTQHAARGSPSRATHVRRASPRPPPLSLTHG